MADLLHIPPAVIHPEDNPAFLSKPGKGLGHFLCADGMSGPCSPFLCRSIFFPPLLPSALGPAPPCMPVHPPPTTSWNQLHITWLSHSWSIFPILFFSVFFSCKTECLDKLTSKVASRTQIKREDNPRAPQGSTVAASLPVACLLPALETGSWTGWHEEAGLLDSHRVLPLGTWGHEPSPAQRVSHRHPVFLPRSPPT